VRGRKSSVKNGLNTAAQSACTWLKKEIKILFLSAIEHEIFTLNKAQIFVFAFLLANAIDRIPL
jgi:hypothetical protein